MKIKHVFEYQEDPTAVPYEEMQKIRKLINKGSIDSTHQWANALDLVMQAYKAYGIQRPTPSMEAGWKQYEDCIQYAVQQLNNATEKGIRDDSWKTLSSTIDGIWN